MKRITVLTVAGLFLLTVGMLFAEPVRNISGKRHPNLAAAQRLVDKAYEKITAAQVANEFDMEGHAAKSKELLDQVNRELKAAAMAANKKK